ncbi:CBS domain-containing protein [Conexibacter sp. SYSU D00693]|uniref:CBS domain-containing protein n=1 Tax=Conexibacter sp. SYSU D00693 TaxID=2812560 RepID=UPI00196A8B8C|nr:CBS domain-containing protein [Conexibacter sp. SYSU D00693]
MFTTIPARAAELLDRPASDLARAGVVRVPPTATFAFVARTMAEHHVHAVLVAQGDDLLGWVTARGMLHNHARDWSTATALDAVTERPARLRHDATLSEAIDALVGSGASHVLLMDDRGRPLSVLADSDVVRHVGGVV